MTTMIKEPNTARSRFEMSRERKQNKLFVRKARWYIKIIKDKVIWFDTFHSTLSFAKRLKDKDLAISYFKNGQHFFVADRINGIWVSETNWLNILHRDKFKLRHLKIVNGKFRNTYHEN